MLYDKDITLELQLRVVDLSCFVDEDRRVMYNMLHIIHCYCKHPYCLSLCL